MEDRVCETTLATSFPTGTVPGSDRLVRQLTTGPGTCYPLYYYIPTITTDGRQLVYHRAHDGEVQLHRLDLATGESVTLTKADAPDAHWRNWCTDPGSGVLDHRSVLDRTGNAVLYFDGPDVHRVGLDGDGDEHLFSIGSDRRAIGQNCVTPDGEWFVYIHHDRALFDRMTAGDGVTRHESRGTVLAAYCLRTGEHRELLRINSPIHHVLPYDDRRLIFCHPATENGMLLTDIDGGWYTHMRTQDASGGTVCHHLATAAGITYEVLGGDGGLVGGIWDPSTHASREFPLPDHFGYTHTGYDPAGQCFFYETAGDHGHGIHWLVEHDPDGSDEWQPIVNDWPTYGGGQKAHFHPQITPDHRWMLVTAGDQKTETNQIYLVDVADLEPTAGLDWA